MDGNKGPSEVERVLQDQGALNALETLVTDGCNRSDLISALQLAFLAEESWEKLVDMNLGAFKRALGQIRNCADLVDRLNRSDLIYRLSIEHRNPLFVGIHESPTLPERLREYAELLDQQRKLFGPKSKIRAHVWKAWVVAIVIENIKRPHDAQVSAIIAAVLDDTNYSEKAHQAWRLKHKKLIEMMRTKVKEQRLRHPPSSLPV